MYEIEVKSKPPLGVMPKYIWDAERLADLTRAIKEYAEAQLRLPNEWIDEYNTLVKLYLK